jgi:hypothetical protein
MTSCDGKCDGHVCPVCKKRWTVTISVCRSPQKKLCHECDEQERG